MYNNAKKNIKDAVKAAKARMASGYSNNALADKIVINSAVIKKDDLAFYRKVLMIINSKEIVTNPIMQLVDAEKYEKYNEDMKNVYILNITRRYIEAKEYVVKHSLTLEKLDEIVL